MLDSLQASAYCTGCVRAKCRDHIETNTEWQSKFHQNLLSDFVK